VILDTNALSAIAEANSGAVAKLAQAEVVAIPVLVLGEFWFGIAHSRYRAEYESWINGNLPACRVLEVTADTAARYAAVRSELKRAGTPIPSNDAWIAALCRQHALPLLSRDKHFDLVQGISRLGW
jgi:tRNA(fMet)-specific endonuclease VapC